MRTSGGDDGRTVEYATADSGTTWNVKPLSSSTPGHPWRRARAIIGGHTLRVAAQKNHTITVSVDDNDTTLSLPANLSSAGDFVKFKTASDLTGWGLYAGMGCVAGVKPPCIHPNQQASSLHLLSIDPHGSEALPIDPPSTTLPVAAAASQATD